MKVIFLGGSNTRKKLSLAAGMAENESVKSKNLSLGGTSSLQNLNTCIGNYKLVKDADLIVTESNINDYFGISTKVVTIVHALENIDKFYQILSELNTKVLSIIMPINFNQISPESFDIFSKINQQHLINIERYGFDYIDLNAVFMDFFKFDKHSGNVDLIDNLMTNALHPKALLMYDIGLNIASYYLKQSKFKSVENTPSLSFYDEKINHFIRLKANDLGVGTEEKSNSAFSVSTIKLDKKIYLPKEYKGYKILGISTWGKGCLKISNKDNKIVKKCNNNYAFNEISGEIFVDEKTYIVDTLESTTERSISTSKIKIQPESFTNLEGFLLEKVKGDTFVESERLKKKNKGKNLDFLIPDFEKYINDSVYFLKKLKTISSESLTQIEIDLIVRSALSLEKTHLKLAYDLMQLAHKKRPNGSRIKKKLKEYKSKLTSKT